MKPIKRFLIIFFLCALSFSAGAAGFVQGDTSQTLEIKINAGATTVTVSGFSTRVYRWKLEGGSSSVAQAVFTGSAIKDSNNRSRAIEGSTNVCAYSTKYILACPSAVKITPVAAGTTTWTLNGYACTSSGSGRGKTYTENATPSYSGALTVTVKPDVTKLTASVSANGNWSDAIWLQDGTGSAGAWQDGLAVELTVAGSCVTQTVSSTATATAISLYGSGDLTLAHAENLVFDSLDLSDYTGHLTVDLSAEGAGMASWTELAGTASDQVTLLYNEEGGALRISEICPKPVEKDPNGVASAWVELENRGTGWVNMNGYELQRYNRGKEWKTGKFANLPSRMVPPGGRVLVYMTEGYTAGDDLMFATEKIPEKGAGTYGGIIIVGAKISPKKYPVVRLLKGADGKKKTEVVDTVVIPSDIDDDCSVIVCDPDATSQGATRRYLTSSLTPGAANPSSGTALGPEVGPLYEGLADDYDFSEFEEAPPAQAGTDYPVTLDVNPVPGGNAGDALAAVKLVYRVDLASTTYSASMTSNEWVEGRGSRWTASIPAAKFPAAGHLIQWKAEITDAAGNVWTSPSGNNGEDGAAWFGTIVEPSADQMSRNGLDTLHIFAASGIADTPGVNDTTCAMNIDIAKLDTSTYPNGARVAIYDSSTSNYYDNVRIDLRGNTTGDSIKKSHGLKFAKTHPLRLARPITMKVDGRTVKVKEVRKTSFIAEFADPSFVRQQLAFWLFNAAGSPAPFDYPVRLNLNGAFYQLAFHSERFSDELIEDVYGLDGLGHAFKNVGQFTCTSGSSTGTTAGGIERKTPDDRDETDVAEVNALATEMKSAGVANVVQSNDGSSTAGLDNAALTQLVVQKFDLAAWINYLATARISQEMDDVWANLSAYYDSVTLVDGTLRGTGTWRPMPYDMNLTFGQWYYNDATMYGRSYMADEDDFKSHPFYGGLRIYARKNSTTYFSARGNWAMEAVWQNKKFRRLYVRRLRTLMDAYLKAPDTAKEDSPLWVKMQEFVTMMGGEASDGDAVRDRTLWGPLTTSGAAGAPEINIWGDASAQPANAQKGIEEIWDQYIVPRRKHLYTTHTASNASNATGYGANVSAGIPGEQSAIAALKAGLSAAYDETLGAVVIRNANAETIDLSGWELKGPVRMTLPAGTVLDQGTSASPGEVYVTADRRTTVGKMTLSNQVVVGNGESGAAVLPINLETADGETVIKGELTDSLFGEDQVVAGHVSRFDAVFAQDGAKHTIDAAAIEAAVAAAGLDGAVVTYATSADGEYSDSPDKKKNAGQYTLYYKVEIGGYTYVHPVSLAIVKRQVLLMWR